MERRGSCARLTSTSPKRLEAPRCKGEARRSHPRVMSGDGEFSRSRAAGSGLGCVRGDDGLAQAEPAVVGRHLPMAEHAEAVHLEAVDRLAKPQHVLEDAA